MNFKLIIVLLALLLMAVFVFQNMEMVSVNFLIWSVTASRVLIYLVIFLIGVLIGWVGKSMRRRRLG